MSKNDDRILELKKTIEFKKKELKASNNRFVAETSCVLDMGGIQYNINVVDEEILRMLMVQLHMHKMAWESLKTDFPIDEPTFNGYTIDQWKNDIWAKLCTITTKRKERELKVMEEKLNKLLSEDKKTELEIDSIAELLK